MLVHSRLFLGKKSIDSVSTRKMDHLLLGLHNGVNDEFQAAPAPVEVPYLENPLQAMEIPFEDENNHEQQPVIEHQQPVIENQNQDQNPPDQNQDQNAPGQNQDQNPHGQLMGEENMTDEQIAHAKYQEQRRTAYAARTETQILRNR